MNNNNYQKKHRSAKLIGMLLLGVILGLILKAFYWRMGKMYGTLSLPFYHFFFFFFIGFYAAMYLQVILHEAGHALFGLLTGYRLTSFRIGNFMWLRQNGKIRLKRFSLAGTVGQCLMEPPELVDGRMPFVLYNAGGFVVNLITVPIFFSLSVVLFGDYPIPASLFLGMACVGLILALQNGFPHKTELVSNDGYNILLLMDSPHALRAFHIQLKANAMLAQGYGYSDMPKEWFVLPPEEEWNNVFQTTLVIMITGEWAKQGRVAEAKEITEKLLQREDAVAGIQRYLLMMEYAYYEMLEGGNAETIERYFAEIPVRFAKAMQKLLSVLRINYAYAVLQKQDEQAAAAMLQQFEACAQTYPYEAEVAEERKHIERIQQLAAQRKTAQS